MTFDKKDKILLFSDGLFEEFNEKQEEFNDKRLYQVVDELRTHPIKAIMVGLVASVKDFSGKQPSNDDITIVGVEFC